MIGIILAGGRATRLGGGDKGDHRVADEPILDRVIAAMRGQCDGLVISANGDPARFARFGLAVVPDEEDGRLGPLAGVLAALDHIARTAPDVAYAVSVPNDAPFLPLDLVARLQDRRIADRAAIVCARSGERTHPVVALWSVQLRADLRRALVEEGLRKVEVFLARHPFATVSWPCQPVDPFVNVNTPDDLRAADRLARSRP